MSTPVHEYVFEVWPDPMPATSYPILLPGRITVRAGSTRKPWNSPGSSSSPARHSARAITGAAGASQPTADRDCLPTFRTTGKTPVKIRRTS